MGRTTEAIDALERARTQFVHAPDLGGIIDAEMLLAVQFEITEQYSKAFSALQRAETACVALPSDFAGTSRHMVSIYSVRGSIWARQGRQDEALICFRGALKRAQALPGKAQLVANLHSNIGTVFSELGQPEGAIEAFSRSLAIRNDTGRAQTVELASTHVNVGVAYVQLGRLEDACAAVQRGLDMQRRLLPADHPDISNSLCFLSKIYALLGRPADSNATSSAAVAVARRSQVACAGLGCTES